MPKRHDAALRVKPILQKGALTLPDADALMVKGIYEQWEKLCERGETVLKGYIFAYGTDLYRVEQPEYTFVWHYVPGSVGTESLFSHVDESHKGTIDDPIPYANGMELYNGKYYIQYDVIYICTRDTGIPVHSDLKDLVKLYVEVANG
ncbi:MAG: hypothetical protein IIX72_00615 [Oscillospiraceae bacterium]|nr:hypothetical protein [Oscillospiraceae bacterium]